MFIKLVGKPNKDISVDIIKKATDFYAEYLMGPKLARNVDITIELKRFPSGSCDYAYCDWEFDNHNSRDFIITLDKKLNRKDTLLALAHEMCHVKQYAKGELKDIFRPVKMVKWMGERYDGDSIDYWECPWEVEAFGRERGMYYKFLEYTKSGETIKPPRCRYFKKGEL